MIVPKNSFYSPLHPGGKTAIAPFIKKVIDENGLVDIDYVELYAGDAGLAISLLLEGYVKKLLR